MKKVLLFLSTFPLTIYICHAQITITQADMPNAGDTLRLSYSIDTLDPMLTGANYTWNYNTLTSYVQWVEKFDSPTAFTFPFNIIFNIANTSYGSPRYTPDSIPFLALKPDNFYNFYKESSSQYKQIGTGFTLSSIPLPISYNPDDIIYRLPLLYAAIDSSDAAYNIKIPGIGYYGQDIHRVNTVDGWGTLITPFGTFQTLRVKSIITARDTFADTTGTGGFSFARPPRYEFKWLKQGGKIPMLQVNATDVGGAPVVTQISYRDSMRGVTQIGVQEFTAYGLQFAVFPNPASDYCILRYDLDSPAEAKIELFDVAGRKVKTLIEEKQTSGKHLQVVNVKELSPQIYFVKISSGKQNAAAKLVVTR